MSYEYMQGLGTAEQATQFVAQAREADSRSDFLQAAALLEQAITADPSRTNELNTRLVQMYAEGGNCSEAQRIWAQISPLFAAGDPNRAQYQQFIDNCSPSAAAATGKQSWWEGGDIEGMFSSFASKLGIGQQTPAAGAQQPTTPGPTSISQIAPNVGSGPSVSVDDDSETPWYVQYTPHLVFGGLGVGAVIVLILALRKKDRR